MKNCLRMIVMIWLIWLQTKLWAKVERSLPFVLPWQKQLCLGNGLMKIYSKHTKLFNSVLHSSRTLQLSEGHSEACKKCMYQCVWQLIFNDHCDSCLISEVITEDPYGQADPNVVWEKIASTLLILFQKEIPDLKVVLPRTIHDRMALLLSHFKSNDRRKLSRCAL